MEVQGLQDLLKKMDDLPLTMGKTLIARALRAGAEPIRERAAELAPDDPTTSGSRIKLNVKTFVLDQTATGASAYITAKPWNYIGRFKEFGTAHESAQPWLRPAFDEKVATALDIIGKTLAESIEKEMAKR